MAYQINKTLTSQDGLTVPTGTYVRQIVQFPEEGGKLQVKLNSYTSQANCEAGKTKYEPSELSSLNGAFEVLYSEFTEQELTTIAAAKSVIEGKIKDKMVAIPAIGETVTIVS